MAHEKRSIELHAHTSPMPRRAFLRGSALAAGGAVAGGGLTGGALASAPSGQWRGYAPLAQATPEALADYEPEALSATEIETLKAVIDRLIPSDDLGPGAVEAGVFIFIDRALAGPEAALLPMYQSGLAAIVAAGGDDGFEQLAADAQDELLTQAEQNGLTDSPEGFFGLLLEHARQGMFGDPIWGGNINFAGWDLIGYPGMKLVWEAEEQEIGTEIEVAHASVEELGGSPELYEGAAS